MFRPCGLRFAPCPRGFSRFAASDKCSTPLLIGLISRCFAHRARASCAPATAILNSQWSFRIFAPPSPSAVRCSVAAHCASLRVLATPALRASEVRPSLAHWAYYGLFRAPRAAFVRPLQFPLKSYGFPGAETARKRFLLWKMGFSGAAYCEPMHPSIQHGRTTALAGSLAALPASLGLLRAVSPTGRALRAPPPYTPPGTIEVRKDFAPLFGFSTV